MAKIENAITVIEMVNIPSGEIVLRDDRIAQEWSVGLGSFLIGRHPITQAQYQAVTGALPSAHQSSLRPVESVSWLDAVRFCNSLSQACGLSPCYEIDVSLPGANLIPKRDGFRLPTEAEWEHACRAGTRGPRYADLDAIAWYRENSGGHPHDVGLKEPNAWGVYDMLGNVWEWCTDLYDPKVYGAYRIFRGGGWADAERGCLATNRRRSHPTFAIDDLGFRVARSV